MTVITNMVVALMIVTQGEEPVRAYPEIEVKRPESPYCVPVGNHVSDSIFNSIVLVRPSDNVETLYRKTCKTNFVYSTTIKTGRIGTVRCRHRPCGLFHAYQPCDLFGRDIEYIGFRVDDWYCPAHEILGGAK